MNQKLIRSFIATSPLVVLTLLTSFGQQPAPTPKEVKIQGVTFESAALPGTSRAWTKVVTQFQTSPRWADGIVFNYSVLLGAMDQYRVLQGIVRYANVKGGANRAVMYISPNTVERFGTPLAVHVKAFYKDDQADEITYKGTGTIPPNWEAQVNKYPGLLLTVIQTPWTISDYSSSPDIFAAQ